MNINDTVTSRVLLNKHPHSQTCTLLFHRPFSTFTWMRLHYYAALLPRRGPHIASHSVCLSVCLSVRPVLVYIRTVLRAHIQNRKTSVFAYGPPSRMYFSAHAEGRISYGHLGGRTNLFNLAHPVFTLCMLVSKIKWKQLTTFKLTAMGVMTTR